MPPIKIKHIVSFTSQDSKYGVDNLCDSSGNSRPWLCSMQDRSGVLRVELQMERVTTIGFIDVGNFGSAFIQIDVGRSSWSLDHPYVILVPTATLMIPADSKQGIGRQGVRMFKKADFLTPAAEESWDRLRVTCTQPFNKQLQFGLSFLRVRTADDQTEGALGQPDIPASLNLHTPDKVTSVTEWLSSPAVQNTFFGRTSGDASPDYSKQSPESLSWAGRMVTAARSKRRSLSTSPCSSTLSTTPQRDNSLNTSPDSSGLGTSSEEARTPNTNKRKSKARQCLVNRGTALKRSRPTASPTHKPISTNSTKGLRTENPASQKLSQSPADMWEPPSPAPQCSTGLISPETMCPLCGVFFSPDYLPLHASTCMDSDPAAFSGVMETAFMTSQRSSPVFGSGTDEPMVPCPICSIRFPPDRIQHHASTCGDTAESSIVVLD